MKKLLTLIAAALVVGTASAASMDWSLDGKSFKTSDGSSERASGYYVALVLASDLATATDALPDADEFDKFVLGDATTRATGAAAGSFNVDVASGTEMTFVMFAFDAGSIADATNYLVSSEFTGKAYAGSDTPGTAAAKADSFSNSSWAKVPSVPEPATGALALAGIALLFRRRKA